MNPAIQSKPFQASTSSGFSVPSHTNCSKSYQCRLKAGSAVQSESKGLTTRTDGVLLVQREKVRWDVPAPSVRQEKRGKFLVPHSLSLNRFKDAHPHWGGQLALLRLLIQMLMSGCKHPNRWKSCLTWVPLATQFDT